MQSSNVLLSLKIILIIAVLAVIAYGQEDNLIRNHQFDNGKRSWTIKDYNDAQMEYVVSEDSLLSGANALCVTVTLGGTSDEDVQVYQSIGIDPGFFYTLSFMARSDVPKTMRVVLQQSSGDQTVYWSDSGVATEDRVQHYGPYRYKSRDNVSGRLKFMLGGTDNVTVCIDSVVITATVDTTYIDPIDKFLYRSHTFQETTLPYRLCPPDIYDPEQKYPLVLALHGAGERGTDNELPISVHGMATTWADSANQADYPCFAVRPQCPVDNQWVEADWSGGTYQVSETPTSDEILNVRDLLDSLMREFSIDTDRIYITGLSMGGYGTFDMIARYPDLFAAAVPMSGAGDTSSAVYINHIPMWIVHGETDGTVPVSGSRRMVRALENTGMNVVYTDCNFGDCTGISDSLVDRAIDRGAGLLYTEIENGGHVIWEPVYTSPQLVRWVFKQNKTVPAGIAAQPASVVSNFQLRQNYPNPFNPVTTMSFEIAETVNVRLEVFNAAGQSIEKLIDGEKSAGHHTITFDGRYRASGVYFYRLTVGDYFTTRKMILLR